jgi:hypothetical protein
MGRDAFDGGLLGRIRPVAYQKLTKTICSLP